MDMHCLQGKGCNLLPLHLKSIPADKKADQTLNSGTAALPHKDEEEKNPLGISIRRGTQSKLCCSQWKKIQSDKGTGRWNQDNTSLKGSYSMQKSRTVSMIRFCS